MCGEFSEGAGLACGMHLCCSATGWCGTTKDHCINADPGPDAKLPCQAGYGSCQIIDPPSCSPDGGSINKRTVGYYQASNVQKRLCQRMTPKQIKLDGFTHLNFAFATIDPVSFKISPADPADIPVMREFTDLSRDGRVQTWIAVGGHDFSDANKPTHRTWSELCSNAENRAAFISSVKDFMKEYGFQGVDLDWEYPGAPERGGKREDTKNFFLLVEEMRALFGSAYGISLPLVPDYWYLRWFDPIAMQKHVDFFGFMAYADLHGPWDGGVGELSSVIRGHTDIADIRKDTLPLWYDGLDPSKINFGLALYGRGYTLADQKCTEMSTCKFTDASKPGRCTNSPGFLSLNEINKLIDEKSLKPKYAADAIMKQISWDDQWIGYDDEETMAEKKKFANSQCFGGTMYWSVDFQPGNSP
ncbi:glycoside hydrolase [Byssothecium circinans]|uniref:chitinase n=1 Tax=Byssothecium circinans TaxID=147558 RepID=A0A6A5TU25_9PLEO|nr:glycoside hydrolase [Byssothecium circinans]